MSNYPIWINMPAAPSPGTARALDTFVKLRRAVNAIGARLNPALLKEHRLTESQFGVLEALYHKGPMAQARLCEKLLVSGSNLTTVVDNLERALATAGDAEKHLAEGVALVHSELIAVLERNGVEQFDPAGEQFDPTVHEALSTRSEEGAKPGVVLDVVEKGYRSNGQVLRPARVVVSG